MILSHLNVKLECYGPHEGKYCGEAHFKDQYGSIEIVLDPAVATKVLELCAEALVQQATKTANLLSGAVLEQVAGNALEDKG